MKKGDGLAPHAVLRTEIVTIPSPLFMPWALSAQGVVSEVD